MWAVPVVHPAYTFRQPQMLGPLEAHVHGFVRRAVSGFPPEPKLYLDPPVAVLQRFLQLCKKQRLEVAIDVETAPPPPPAKPEWALLPQYARLRAVGIGAALNGRDNQGEYEGVGLSWFWPMPERTWWQLKSAFEDRQLAKVLCNGQAYDIPILRRYCAKFFGAIEDIRDGRRALVSTSRTGLGEQSAMYLQCAAWKAAAVTDDDDAKGFIDPSKIKRRKLLQYNAEDCVRTAQVRQIHKVELKGEDYTDRVRLHRLYSQQKRLAEMAADMSIKGFPVDEKQRRLLAKDLTTIAQAKAAELKKLTKRRGNIRVNIGRVASDDVDSESGGGVNARDLAALIFRECSKPGIRCFNLEVPFSHHSRTESGKASVKKQALLTLFGQDNVPEELKQIIHAVWKVNAPLKARNTFVESDQVLARIGPDGRMHASINSCGTETGRWSCSKPNLFNLSEDKKEGESIRGELPSVRSMYVAGKGRVIVHKDVQAFELWVICEYTEDEALFRMLTTIDPLKGEPDAHSMRARMSFGIPATVQVPKAVRRIAKEIGLSCNYHASVEVPWLKVLEVVPDARFEEVAKAHADFPDIHKGIAAHWARSLAFAELHGFNETPIMGRRRYYPPGQHLKDTETANYSIQGGAADIANSAMVGSCNGYDQMAGMLDTNVRTPNQALYYRLKREYPDAWIAMHVYDSWDVICKEKDAEGVSKLMDECIEGPWQVNPNRPPRKYKVDTKIGYRWSDV